MHDVPKRVWSCWQPMPKNGRVGRSNRKVWNEKREILDYLPGEARLASGASGSRGVALRNPGLGPLRETKGSLWFSGWNPTTWLLKIILLLPFQRQPRIPGSTKALSMFACSKVMVIRHPEVPQICCIGMGPCKAREYYPSICGKQAVCFVEGVGFTLV